MAGIADFSGWATKAGLKCSDGRTIMKDAFAHMAGKRVPLVWSHGHGDPENVLGYADLEHRDDGVYAYAYFNDTPKAQHAKKMVQHGDVVSLSIYANKLVERQKQVFHGVIRELSLVLSGANPGALIDNVAIVHGDGDTEVLDDEVVIFTGLSLEHEDKADDTDAGHSDGKNGADEVEHADGERTGKDIYDSLNEEQKAFFHNALALAVGEDPENEGDDASHSDSSSDTEDTSNTDEGDLNHQEGNEDMRNVFEHADGDTSGGTLGGTDTVERHVLSHSDIAEIKATWKRGGSFRSAVEEFALSHGIENLDALFPDPKSVPNAPQFDKRRTEWVNGVINGVSRSPFSRVKTLWADITQESARALGYIKGNLKKEEWFGLKRRVTTPATVYKKQKLDRDDILDATDFDFVPWMKAEMRMMTEEEVARAILIGDGRPVEDPENPGEPNPDKIKDPGGDVAEGAGVRSILNDNELFAATVYVPIPDAGDSDQSYQGAVESIMLNMEYYKGSGSPTLYTTLNRLNRMLLSKDGFGRRLWRTKEELATEMGVENIVAVDVMADEPTLFGIIVNLRDYNVGTDRGGEMTMFDDFDLDYNQYKYLLETRFSGALVKIRSALVLKVADSDDVLVAPNQLAFDDTTNTIDYVAQTGVVYSLTPGGTALAADEIITEDTTVYARPASGYRFDNNLADSWDYTFNPDA